LSKKMPVIILTGTPSVGKTYVANLFAERARELFQGGGGGSNKSYRTVIVNEESLNLTKKTSYETSKDEKVTRGALRAALERSVIPVSSKNAYGTDFASQIANISEVTVAGGSRKQQEVTIAILDSLNYIKGYRYELHCLSKSLGQQHCVVWVKMGSVGTVAAGGDSASAWEIIKKWNSLRENNWTDTQMKEMVMRYERPDERNRWDKPLYVVDMLEYAKENTTNPGVDGIENVAAAAGSGDKDDNTSTKDAGKSASGEASVVRSVYNMHSVNDAIDTVQSSSIAASKGRPLRAEGERNDENPHRSSSASSPPRITGSSVPSPPDVGVPVQSWTHSSLVERIDDILRSFLCSAPLKNGRSTTVTVEAGPNVLHDVDSITQRVASEILKKMRSYIPGSKLAISQTQTTISLTRRAAPGDIRRLRLAFVRWVGSHPPEDTTEAGVASSFLAYVGAHFR